MGEAGLQSSGMTAGTELLQAMTRVADPLADHTVAAIVGPWSDAPGAMDAAMARLAQATRLMAQWRSNAVLADWQPDDPATDPALAALLRDYLREGSRLPAWLDAAKVTRAEDIFMQEGPLSCTLLFCASLPECYVPPQLAEVLRRIAREGRDGFYRGVTAQALVTRMNAGGHPVTLDDVAALVSAALSRSAHWLAANRPPVSRFGAF